MAEKSSARTVAWLLAFAILAGFVSEIIGKSFSTTGGTVITALGMLFVVQVAAFVTFTKLRGKSSGPFMVFWASLAFALATTIATFIISHW